MQRKKNIPTGDWLPELRDVVRGEVSTDAAALNVASTDASIFKVMPAAVVAPKDVEDVKALVRFVSRKSKGRGQKLSLTARSGGTDMSGGPLTESIVVDFAAHINHFKGFYNGEVTAEPGMFYRNLEPELDRRGLVIPSYPASKSICTIGGMVSNNSGGEKTLAYGKTEKYVTALKVVFSDGKEYEVRPLNEKELKNKIRGTSFESQLYKKLFTLITKNQAVIDAARPAVSKNSAGYYLWNVCPPAQAGNGITFDLTKLIVGSQGTLALVTEATFKPIKKKRYSRLVVMFLKDLTKVGEVATTALKFKPESFESYDDNTMKIALKFLPDLVKVMKVNMISLALRFLPEFFMLLRGGIPKLILMIELTSDDERELEIRLAALKSSLKKFGDPVRITKNEAESEKYWAVRRESFNLLRNRIRDRRTAPFVDDIIVRPEKLSEFLPQLNAIFEPYGNKLIYTIAGHVGDGNFHIIPLMNLSDPESRRLIPEIAAKVYPLVISFGGSITAEHNDGLIRTPYLEMMYGEKVCTLFKEVKKIFDPLDIFNPGKKVDGDLDYAMAHMKRG